MQKPASRHPAGAFARLEFPFAEPPAPGTITEVADGVYWLRMRLPFALDHINLWLLRDGNSWTAIDTGLSNEETRGNWLRVLSGSELASGLRRIIVTHYHPDHMGNAGWLTRRLDIPMWCSESEYLSAHTNYSDTAGNNAQAVAHLFRDHGLEPEWVAAIAARGNGYRKIISEPPDRYVRLLNGDEINIGEHVWHVITGYGHAPEHSALYCASLGVLISGDMLLPKISTNVSVWPFEPLGDPLKLFLRSIDRFRELPEDTLVLPSHGLPFTGAHLRVNMLHQHHEERLADVRNACAEPSTAAQLLPTLFRRKLDTHQLFFAMGESIAHLNNLWYRNELERLEDGADGVYRFALPGQHPIAVR
ncbi:MAG: MBL fold metallo-hydrolase [Burkholderiales bacterium]|jgi:glyoxylase-like metal-dependent hydrolase (beta-lactamase superfamily II)